MKRFVALAHVQFYAEDEEEAERLSRLAHEEGELWLSRDIHGSILCNRVTFVVPERFRIVQDRTYRDEESILIEDRDALIERGVVDAHLYRSRWLVVQSGLDDVIEMFDDWKDAEAFRRTLLEEGGQA